jgi:membrane associated rhomboid family serine protease
MFPMMFLWAFGKSLEDAMGHTKFLGFYFACGIIAGIVHVIFNYDSRMPTVGASGAIAGVMGGYLIKFPRANIRTLVFLFVFITTVDIPAVWLLLFWFVAQIFSGYGSIAQTNVTNAGVAWFAHIGGFVSGMILVKTMGTRTRYFPRGRDIYW